MINQPPHKSAKTRTRRAIINLLKQEGAMDSQALASRLGVSAMAVRQHLYALQDEHLVSYEEESRTMGRPAKLWSLTANANRFFPDGYAELTLGLIRSVVEVFGDAGLDQILEVKTRDQIADYVAQLPNEAPLAQQVETLAALRTEEGYMAEVQTLDDGSFLLVENHCPICATATACVGLCQRELEVFQTVLGDSVSIERTEHIIAGARRCAYRISHGN
jgi:predicted ArsR family transcriptional regulator